MSVIKEVREFFIRATKVTSGTKKDQETSYPLSYSVNNKTVYNRFLKNHVPGEATFKKLFESITFKLNIEDTASTTEQGLVKIATDTQAKNRTPKEITEFTTVVAPEQLSDILNTASLEGGTYTQLTNVTANGLNIKELSKNLGGGRSKKDFLITLDVSNAPIPGLNSVLISEYQGLEVLVKKYVSIDSIATKMPTGSIMLYNNITPPAGWYLCDGTNGTPDMGSLRIGTTYFMMKS